MIILTIKVKHTRGTKSVKQTRTGERVSERDAP